jgi:YidC/Oxa1 family membrane protein insertase
MGMDRNTIIGFTLIGALLIGMFYINSKSRLAHEGEEKRKQDSIAATLPKKDTALAKLDSLKTDSLRQEKKQTALLQFTDAKEQLVVVENEVLKITFSSIGGQPKMVELKKYKTHDGKPLVLMSGNFNKFSYAINTGNNQTAQTSELPFAVGTTIVNADKSQSISFSLKDSLGKELVHQYTIKPNDYLIDFSINMTGADKWVSQNTVNILWQAEVRQAEKDVEYERQQTHIAYLKDGDFDFEYLGSGDDKKFTKPVNWLSVKQQFFINAVVAKDKFQSADIKWEIPKDTLAVVATTTANMRLSVPNGATAALPLQLYYGPSDYNVLKKYGNQMEKIVPYGTGVFSFVKYINRHFLLPVFDFLANNVASMGLVILLLTLIIRLITSPILYKSYLSGAKMKALKPEIDELKAKYKSDQQAFSMEQMKLWKSAGVSPLGGCLPALLQIPIFMSLYYFFQSNISLRDKGFLWANDLSAYDSIATLPFNIPFYGDHVSLFTLTAVITSLLISIYSMSSMQDNTNPVMKYMPYIFPVILLGVFNNLPAALTWYYTVSNTITLLLQIVIQKYIIKHDKIRAKIDENRKKPVKTSGWAQKVQQMQENSKRVQEMRNKTNKR